MEAENTLITQVLQSPERVNRFSLSDWDLLIRQARSANLLARLHFILKKNNLISNVPQGPRLHIESAGRVAQSHRERVIWEVRCIQKAMEKTGIPVILLKGAAYTMSDLPPSYGRFFTDVDILVPKDELEKVENTLLIHGWKPSHRNAYDQRYYRQWMHELPPFQHLRRRSVLDVHHTILPETAHLHPDPEKLIGNAVSINNQQDLKSLSPIDMILHSATHLFSDGELEHGLRDLVDLDALLRHFTKNNIDFWNDLTSRADEMELSRPLYYALKHTNKFLNTPVPENILNSSKGHPVKPLAWLMDKLFSRGLQPDHSSCSDMFTGLARRLLYIRSHYLRMPLYLLIPHLLRKAWIRRTGDKA
jgi:hypothetical protein